MSQRVAHPVLPVTGMSQRPGDVALCVACTAQWLAHGGDVTYLDVPTAISCDECGTIIAHTNPAAARLWRRLLTTIAATFAIGAAALHAVGF